MKIYAIHGSGHNWNPGIRFFHRIMFHGEAIVVPGRMGRASHDVDEWDHSPMRLVVNGFHVPDVFVPDGSSTLVVAERVRERLEPLSSGILFLPVTFEKVYVLPWSVDGSYELDMPKKLLRFWQRGKELSIPKACPNEPGRAATLPPYYEVATHNHFELFKRFPPTHRFFTSWYDTEPVEADLLPVSEAMFREYPITNPGYTVVRDDIFKALSPFLERQFFGIKEFSFDG